MSKWRLKIAFYVTFLRPIKQKLLQVSVRKISLKITLIKFFPHLSGVNELRGAQKESDRKKKQQEKK